MYLSTNSQDAQTGKKTSPKEAIKKINYRRYLAGSKSDSTVILHG
jgi:hypothetical protein